MTVLNQGAVLIRRTTTTSASDSEDEEEENDQKTRQEEPPPVPARDPLEVEVIEYNQYKTVHKQYTTDYPWR